MDGPHHYDRAERAAAAARGADTDIGRTHHLMFAQYHATMAQTDAILTLAQVVADSAARDTEDEPFDVCDGWTPLLIRPFVPCDYVVDESDTPDGPWGPCTFPANHPQSHQARTGGA